MMEPRRYQWALALLFALVAHFAVAKLLETPAPIELDQPGIRISLRGAGPADGGDGAADGVESIDSDTLPTETLEATVARTVGAAPLVPVLATVTETIRAAEPAPSAPITAAEPVTPKPKAETARSRETPPPRTARAAPKPKQKPETASPTKTPRSTAAKAGHGDADVSGNATGKGSAGGTGALAAAGAGSGGAAGKSDGGKSKDRYYAELAAWLERHKRYPPQARKMRQEGIVRVRFVIDRSGKVISHRIETSSGHTALDHAASDLLRRASPMPAIPASMGRSRLEIVVPIAYRLR
jgi:periplasmic protein TonB